MRKFKILQSCIIGWAAFGVLSPYTFADNYTDMVQNACEKKSNGNTVKLIERENVANSYPIFGIKNGGNDAAPSACFKLLSPGVNNVGGTVVVYGDGRWVGILGGEAHAVSVTTGRDDDAKKTPSEITNRQSGFFASTTFEISSALSRELLKGSDESYVYLHFKLKADSPWNRFEHDRLREPGRINVGELRKALEWSGT